MQVGRFEVAEVLSVVTRRTWATPKQVAEGLRCGVEEASDVLQALVETGWLEFWPQTRVGQAPRLTLTPWAAERLGLRLNDSRCWVPITDPDPPPRVPPKRETIQQSAFDRRAWRSMLERQVDPCADEPWVAVALAEAIGEAWARGLYRGDHGLERLPFPAMFLGLSATWAGKAIMKRRRRCRACGSRQLQPHEFCLQCDNWGLGRVRPKPKRRARRQKR
jgi:hypothetical protein